MGLPEGLLCSPLPGPARSQLRQGLGVEAGHQGKFTPSPITRTSFHSAFLVLPPQTKPPPSQPSNKAYNDKNNNKNHNSDNKKGKGHKRDLSSTEKTAKPKVVLRTSKPVVLNFCPSGYEQCPVAGVSGEHECLETLSEMTSCGGCTSVGAGVDCTKIPHVEYASCYGGFCSGTSSPQRREPRADSLLSLVFSCEGGYKPSDDERSCVPA